MTAAAPRLLTTCRSFIRSKISAGSARPLKRTGASRRGWHGAQAAAPDQYWAQHPLGDAPAELGGYRLYQDGLPVLRQGKRRSSPSWQKRRPQPRAAGLAMCQRGGDAHGKPSHRACCFRNTAWRKAVGARSAAPPQSRAFLLQRRDAFIAHRIGETLQPGEIGIPCSSAPARGSPPCSPADIRLDYRCSAIATGAPPESLRAAAKNTMARRYVP